MHATAIFLPRHRARGNDFLIRRRAANQFRKSGMALISQPCLAQNPQNDARAGRATFQVPVFRALKWRQLPVGPSEFDDYSDNGIPFVSAIATLLLQMAIALRSPWRVGDAAQTAQSR
jgi:hypothetical protein